MTAIQLTHLRNETRVDTRIMAGHLGRQHQNVYEMVKDYQADFEQLGVLRFQTGEPESKGGRPEKYALLNEDQCYLLLAFSRNTAKVRQLKVNLVLAFKDARENANRKTTAHDRAPIAHKTIDIALDRRVSPSTVQGAVNRWVGVRRSRYMSMQQAAAANGLCDRLLARNESADDLVRIETNSIALYGQPPQLSLLGAST